MKVSSSKLNQREIIDMNYDEFVDKIAYSLNCLTECTGHKISWACAAVGISPGELYHFE